MEKLYISDSNGTYDATELVPTITWSGDYRQCARSLELSLLSSPTDANIPTVPCELGSPVVYKQDDRTLFSGYIFKRQKLTSGSMIYLNCWDRGIYLKRNEAVYKFTAMTPEAITRRICSDFGIKIGEIAETGVKLSRNFIGVSLYRIIQTAYTLAAEKTGDKYQLRFNDGELTVVKTGVTEQTLIIEGGSNLMSAATTESITDMINQVNIYNSEGSLISVRKDDSLIKLYGLFQSYIRQPEGEDAVPMADKLLKDNGVSQTITIENLGNVANVTGGCVVVREPYTGVYGLFHIISDIHTWKCGQYYNKLTVSFERLMDSQEAGELPNASGSLTSSDTWKYLYKPG